MDQPARTTPVAVVMDDDMKGWYRQAAREAGMPTNSLIRRVLARHRLMTTRPNRPAMNRLIHQGAIATPDPLLERRDAQLRKGVGS